MECECCKDQRARETSRDTSLFPWTRIKRDLMQRRIQIHRNTWERNVRHEVSVRHPTCRARPAGAGVTDGLDTPSTDSAHWPWLVRVGQRTPTRYPTPRRTTPASHGTARHQCHFVIKRISPVRSFVGPSLCVRVRLDPVPSVGPLHTRIRTHVRPCRACELSRGFPTGLGDGPTSERTNESRTQNAWTCY